MSNPLTMFHDDDGDWSMTRVVAFAFGVVECIGVLVMAKSGNLHEIGWPFAALGAVTLLAVPLQALFKTIAEWMKTAPAKKLLFAMTEKFTKAAGGEG